MKRNRIILFATVLTLVFTLAVMAQGRGRMGGQAPALGAGQQALGQGMARGPEWLATYLELTELQITAWKTIRDEAQAAAAGVIETRKANFGTLQGLLSATTTPDPNTVGSLVIQNHALGAQIRAIHEAAQAKFVDLLTDAQEAKYNQFLELQKSMRRGRGAGAGEGTGAGMGFGSGFGGGFGGGFGPGDGTCPCCEE